MNNHTKDKFIIIVVEVNNPILGDGGGIVVHTVTKNLEMFTLVACEWNQIHHEECSFTNLDHCYKITNENISSLSKLDQSIIASNNVNK
jgi:hypothetical protein